jgi:RNA polymerase sigma-70 factor (ECF subfamily)
MDDVVARAQKGDPRALEALLDEIAPKVLRFGLRVCGNAHDADDALQDTLLTVARRIREFEGRASLDSWVFTVTRNACLRRRRGLKNEPPHAEDHSDQRDPSSSPETRAAARELLTGVLDALGTLPLEAREVIALRDVEGLSATEAATVLGITPEALKSRLHRARTALRARLRPLLEADAAAPGADCPDIMTLWSRKLEGELSELDCAKMETHLRGCPSCGGACTALKQALELCRSSAKTPVPPEIHECVKAAVEAWRKERG